MKILIKSIIFTIALFSFMAGGLFAARVVLPEDTDITVQFDNTTKINSGNVEAGQMLDFTLAEDIKIGGKTVVEAGAPGKAEVVDLKKASAPGKPGYIKIKFTELGSKGEFKTAEDAPIKLSGEFENKGKGKSFLTKIPLLYGFFVGGGQGKVDTKATYNAKVAETIVLESE